MKEQQTSIVRHENLPKTLAQAALFFILLFISYLIYQIGFSAGFQLDDAPNLSQLSTITDIESALAFITSGEAGPLGRPISLLTFALQAAYWPSIASEFIRTNVLIHLINTSLVTFLSFQILNLRPTAKPNQSFGIAILITAIWALQPISSSTLLMSIQRMTLLSGMFVLIGLIFYIKGRSILSSKPIKAYALMSFGIIGCTILAAYSKENGALLPFYALVLEITVIAPTKLNAKSERYFFAWKTVIFTTPALALLYYVITTWNNLTNGYALRTFTLSERLATESVVLWEYARQIIAPNILTMGPFQDDYPIMGWNTLSVISVIVWTVLLITALIYRRKLPLFSLGILLYLCGHSLESTIFPLELYFEHRNYLPSLGIIALLAFFFALLTKQVTTKLLWIAALYPLGLSLLLLQTTTLWGSPVLAAEVWLERHPYSPRSAQNYSQKLILQKNRLLAANVIKESSLRIPEDSGLAMQALQLNCQTHNKEAYSILLNDISSRIHSMYFSGSAIAALHELINMALDNKCPHLNLGQVEKLGNLLLDNPNFINRTISYSDLHLEMARIHSSRNNIDSTIHHLTSSYHLHPRTEALAFIVGTLASIESYNEAKQWLDFAKNNKQENPTKQREWEAKINELQKYIIASQKSRN